MTPINGGGVNMDTVNKIINEISQNLANAIVEGLKYTVLYEESNEENKRVNELLSKFNDVLDSDQTIKELFDENSSEIRRTKGQNTWNLKSITVTLQEEGRNLYQSGQLTPTQLLNAF